MTGSFFTGRFQAGGPTGSTRTWVAHFTGSPGRHVAAGYDPRSPTHHVGPHVRGEWTRPCAAGREPYAEWLSPGQAGSRLRWCAVRRDTGCDGWCPTRCPSRWPDDRPTVTVGAVDPHAVRLPAGTSRFSLGEARGAGGSREKRLLRERTRRRAVRFLGRHVYRIGGARYGSNYAAAWVCELVGTFGPTW